MATLAEITRETFWDVSNGTMKELKMFPQITEETEENLLNLEDEPKSPYSSTPPLNPSSSSSESPPDAPSSPNHENQVPCLLPTITTEDVDRTVSPNHQNPPPDEEFSSPPPRTRMRSLSGGAYRLAPALPSTGRHRRQSGDDVLTRVSPSRRATLFEQFRPRSKSDSKGKRPTFLTTLKNSLLGGSVQRKTSLDSDPPVIEPLHPSLDYKHRPRSGSETKGGTMSKMIDLFRSRSHSVSYDSKGKMVPPVILSNSNDKVKRRVKRPYVNTYRSFDTHKGDSYGCHSEDETSDSRFDFGSLDEEKIIPSFFSARTCYDAMPKSGKVVVLSTELLVKNAFNCLVTNEIRAAPLWESSSQTFVGLLTISDFINVLRHYYYSSQSDIKDIENQKIVTWKKITNITRPIVKIPPSDSLVNATKLLIEERIHRLPVYDERRNSVLFVISRKRLLQYLYNNLVEKFGKTNLKVPSFWRKTIGELKAHIGTWENIATVSLNTKVIEALDLFCERQVSALPVMDEDNKLVDIFAKFDVFALAKEQTYDNLDMTVAEALDKAEVHEDVYGCTLDEPLGTVIDRFVAAKVHRLVVVDSKQAVIGILSLSDILKFLVLQPLEDSAVTSDIIDEAPEGAVGGEEDSSVFLDSGQESSGNFQKSSSLEKQDSSDLSEGFVKLQLEADTPEPLSETSICEDDP